MDEVPESFTVDLHGIVELLSDHLYSGPQVYIRELLQNAVDAIAARGSNSSGRVRFDIDEVDGRPTLVATDEGVGLTEAEARSFMGVIGRSSKRDELGMARESLVGQFGIGILSCFAVSDSISVVSRSAFSEQAICWTGKSDGTWTVKPGPRDQPIGSKVTVTARRGEDRWFDPDLVLKTLRDYGELLRVPILFSAYGQGVPTLVSRVDIPTRLAQPTADEVCQFGRDLLGFEPIDAFPINSVSGQATGIAYILPGEPSPGAKRADRIYIKGMLVDAQCDHLLPDWAFFVRCIVEADGLRPTASREQLHHDDAVEEARVELGESVKSFLVQLAEDGSDRLAALVATHHLSLKALAIVDPEFCSLVADWLPVVSAEGGMSFGRFRAKYPRAIHTATVDEFRQMAPIALAQNIGLLCGGYTHDLAFINMASTVLENFVSTHR